MLPTKDRSRFGHQLRLELERHQSIKTVRRLSRVLSPTHPESSRRLLSKWIAGDVKPNEQSRGAVADALGVPRETFADDDEEEAASLMSLDDFLRLRIRQLMQEEAPSR